LDVSDVTVSYDRHRNCCVAHQFVLACRLGYTGSGVLTGTACFISAH
jgi:hypothetical protein